MTAVVREQSFPEEPADAPSQRETLRAWLQFARTYAKFAQRMHRYFGLHGLTGPQFDVLATLHRWEGLMQQELAARTLVTKGNVTGVVDRMEKLDWIERRPDPTDRRVNRLYLTDAGRAKFAEANSEHDAVVHEMMSGFRAEEVQTLSRLLQTLEKQIDP